MAKEQDEELEEEFGEENFDEEDTSEEEIEDGVKVKKEKTGVKKQKKENNDWIIEHIPESFRVVDHKNKKIVLAASSIEELRLQLQLMTAQQATEAAINLR